MLIILPIMLCCTAQKFTIYAQNYAQIMPNYSSHALLIISSLWINNKWLKQKLTCQNAYHRKDQYTLIEQSAM